MCIVDQNRQAKKRTVKPYISYKKIINSAILQIGIECIWWNREQRTEQLTPGGPIIVPVHDCMNISSASSIP